MAVLIVSILAAVIFAPQIYTRIQKINYPLKYEQDVFYWAKEYEVDPFLVFAIIRTESGFDPHAESDVGARGLMQMTSDTFDWIKSKIAPQQDLSFEALYSPATSVQFGTYYLRICLERYGQDVSTAAAAYHSGWGTVDRLRENEEYSPNGVYLTVFPYKQMNHYVYKVNKSYDAYSSLYRS